MKQVLATLLCLAAVAPPAEAELLTFHFTATATDGLLAGQSSSGYFSFDSGIVPAVVPENGVAYVETNALSDLDFVWNGIHYDETSANTGALVFHPNGTFSGCLGTYVGPGYCGAGGLQNQWVIAIFDDGHPEFAYSFPDGTPAGGVHTGTITFLEPLTVPNPPFQLPEPPSWALAALALAGLLRLRPGPERCL